MMRALAIAVASLSLLAASVRAQDSAHASSSGAEKKARAHKSAPAKKPATASKSRSAPKKGAAPAEIPAPKTDKQTPDTKAGHAEAAAQAPAEPPAAPAQATGDVRTEGDTQVKVMQFSGLDIEGQLKTPQMLYFLNRMRAEFGRPRLPHRSFMPELQRSTKEDAF